jgi:crotonobetainyl-CoA:carnitine CoA-transferase CaiB-like acyl-CoA transferase
MTAISNFGQTGPYRDYKASDLVHYGMAGFSYRSDTERNGPLKGPPYQSQQQAGMNAFMASMNGLMARDLTRKGQYIDVSILESMCAVFQPEILHHSAGGGTSDSITDLSYPAGPLQCKDGYISLFAPQEPFWSILVGILDLDPAILEDPRFMDAVSRAKHAAELDKVLLPAVQTWEKEKLFEEVSNSSLVAGMVLSSEELFTSEHLDERGFFVDIDHTHTGKLRYPGPPFHMSETPWRVRSPAPLLGQHNEEVLGQKLGYTTENLVQLRQQGII